ncbi:MAG: hypothetical protein HPY64_02870 [Anaerolineae bacterium]|nr:hypothetical protein [Anaerolineae bacterium]
MTRWEILEIVERNGVLVKANLYRPLGQTGEDAAAYQLPFTPEDDAVQLIGAVLFDGFEPMAHTAISLPDGTLQNHWVFRMPVG